MIVTFLFMILLCATTTHSQQDSTALARDEFMVHPSKCFDVKHPLLFENGGLNDNPRVVAKKDAQNRFVYVHNYGPTYFANKNTLIRALAQNECNLASVLINEKKLPLNTPDTSGLTPLYAMLFVGKKHKCAEILLEHGALIHNPPHHTAYQLLFGIFKWAETIPPQSITRTLLKQGLPHLSSEERKTLREKIDENLISYVKMSDEFNIKHVIATSRMSIDVLDDYETSLNHKNQH